MPEVSYPVVAPASYFPVHALAFGAAGRAGTPVSEETPLPVADILHGAARYSSAVTNFVPVAGATDIAVLGQQFHGRLLSLQRISIRGTADSPATIDVLLQRTPNGPSGLAQPVARHDPGDTYSTGVLWTFGANRESNGNGVSGSRPVLRVGKLTLGTATQPGSVLEWRFDADGAPTIKMLSEWIAINLGGQSLPGGTSLSIDVEWTEPAIPPVLFAGDSTTAGANALFTDLAWFRPIARTANVQNLGSNGYRLIDYLLHTNGIPYPQGWGGVLDRFGGSGSGATAAAGRPGVLVLCYGINDVRGGAVGAAELISRLDAAIHATKQGTIAGETYVSPVGAGSAFTWPANIPPNPDAQIILWGPNGFATDGNDANYVSLTGLFEGKSLAEAAQLATDILREAYDAFDDDPRVFKVVQKQALFGEVATSVAQSGLMTDILHPNDRGQRLSARQILPVIRQALVQAGDIAF